jgi:hypothetical protein
MMQAAAQCVPVKEQVPEKNQPVSMTRNVTLGSVQAAAEQVVQTVEYHILRTAQ